MNSKSTKAELWNVSVERLIRITELEQEVAMLRQWLQGMQDNPVYGPGNGWHKNCAHEGCVNLRAALTATADNATWLKAYDRQAVKEFLKDAFDHDLVVPQSSLQRLQWRLDRWQGVP